MKRIFDIILSLVLLIVFCVPMLVIALISKMTSEGSILYWSERTGKENTIFRMPKFRTMKVNSPVVASHLLRNPQEYLTPFGRLLRKTSLDELPQLFSILKGDMSFVGPRPALYNQEDLITLRTQKGVHVLTPGLTGWAQINGRDELSISRKVELDDYYRRNRSFLFDLKILTLTVIKVMSKEDIRH